MSSDVDPGILFRRFSKSRIISALSSFVFVSVLTFLKSIKKLAPKKASIKAAATKKKKVTKKKVVAKKTKKVTKKVVKKEVKKPVKKKVSKKDEKNAKKAASLYGKKVVKRIDPKSINTGIAKRAFFGALDEMGRYWVLSSSKRYSVGESAKQISDIFIKGIKK